ncbi:hypothetical protein PC129_g21224 [Phytophthora cactorum]|uniref:Uncharacterized protein n=1 Tax=Phytophthora cactorum TaxID=29920 RepID=A0A329SNE1_9STRA|nr:hypothetical protein Pcac1_g77 [Phytophthora cactorum]KAG2796909.1 hypothetical protein PC111_g21513 [Phytophthora cactorum]KAG2797144.1 hypothetical protein PC112_g21902 [Phytophthora cactorum]KAG2826088.1 hypothetical protein PC113_g21827 [Phytophthora cactorum]KAG2876174.1 hypothetical protein PC114_g24339 [Phytophthora cactorum]
MEDLDAQGYMTSMPPPPPPPPPPQDDLKKRKLTLNNPNQPKPRKKKDFREILALFHDEEMDAAKVKREWSALCQMTLAESQEDHKRRRQQEQHGIKRKKNENDHGPISARGGPGSLSRLGSMNQDHLKRARQGSAASTDSSESGKGSRLGGRFPKNVPKGSKLMQKFGGRP